MRGARGWNATKGCCVGTRWSNSHTSSAAPRTSSRCVPLEALARDDGLRVADRRAHRCADPTVDREREERCDLSRVVDHAHSRVVARGVDGSGELEREERTRKGCVRLLEGTPRLLVGGIELARSRGRGPARQFLRPCPASRCAHEVPVLAPCGAGYLPEHGSLAARRDTRLARLAPCRRSLGGAYARCAHFGRLMFPSGYRSPRMPILRGGRRARIAEET